MKNRVLSGLLVVAMVLVSFPMVMVSATREVVWRDLSFRIMSDERLAQMVESGEIPHNITNLVLSDFWSNTQISDLTPLSGLSDLRALELNGGEVSDLTPLAGLTNLEVLLLPNNQIIDLTPLQGLINLERLNLSRNQISDITPLAELTNLEILELNNNRISDVAPLIELKKLNWLYLSDNQISDPSPLAELTRLSILNLANNQISDISFLEHCRRITGLSLDNNQISDITPLMYLRLQGLDLGFNQISDVSPITWSLGSLTELNLHNNRIADISPFFVINMIREDWGLKNLRAVRLHNNPLPLSQVNEFRELAGDGVDVFHGSSCADCEMLLCQCPPLTLVIENGVIHIHNPTDTAISARGFYLTNDDGTPNQRLPAVIIRAGETVQVRHSGDETTHVLKRMTTNFDMLDGIKLSSPVRY